MLYFQAKEKLTTQTEEWINMINRQVEEEIAFYEQQADMVRIILYNIVFSCLVIKKKKCNSEILQF